MRSLATALDLRPGEIATRLCALALGVAGLAERVIQLGRALVDGGGAQVSALRALLRVQQARRRLCDGCSIQGQTPILAPRAKRSQDTLLAPLSSRRCGLRRRTDRRPTR